MVGSALIIDPGCAPRRCCPRVLPHIFALRRHPSPAPAVFICGGFDANDKAIADCEDLLQRQLPTDGGPDPHVEAGLATSR